MEAVETFLRQELGGSEVEVGIKFVNDALETQHGEQSGRECWREEGFSKGRKFSSNVIN